MSRSLASKPEVLNAGGEGDAMEMLLDLVQARRDHYHAAGHVDQETVQAMRAAGFYRALVPERFGGDGLSPAEFLRMVERVSVEDGSAGWVASFGAAHTYLAALPLETLETLYANDRDIVFAGGLFPPQPAEEAPGGYLVSGKWSFVSGAPGASLIGVGIKAGEGGSGLPLVAVMPARQVEIVPEWDVIGMRGTVSYVVKVDRVFVPREWTFVRGSTPSVDLPVYRYPAMSLAAQVLAVVGLGVARAALDHLAGMATKRASITGAPVLADRAHVQIALARGEADLRSARAFFYEVTEEAWASLLAGEDISRQHIALLRLAASQAARVGADVARLVFQQAGTAGIFNTHMLSRWLQDSAVVAQHAFLTEGTWQSAGQALLGLPTPAGYP